jgi:quinolinate synthase
VLYRRKLADGGLTAEQVRQAKMILWEGHCYVHTRFRAEDVDRLHAEYADRGGIRVIVHPECRREVVDRADDVGSTEHIIRSIDQAEPGTNWAVGTEVHLVNRLAARHAARGVLVRMLGDAYCMCAQMSRIDSQHLLWVLDNLGRGRVINRVTVEPSLRRAAGLAVDRMLGLGGGCGMSGGPIPSN